MVLNHYPRWAELPLRPKVNNYRADGNSRVDKALRVTQQQLLHLLRFEATAFRLAKVSRGGAADSANPGEEEQAHEGLLVALQQLSSIYRRQLSQSG